MHDEILRIREVLRALQEALADFTAGNRGRLFESRVQLRDLADRVGETPWKHVTPICEGVQKLLGNVLRYGELREEDSVALASELLKFVDDAFDRPPSGDSPRITREALQVEAARAHAARSQQTSGEAPISVSTDLVTESLLGEVLLKMGRVDSPTLHRALGLQQVCRKRLGEVLISIGAIDESVLREALEQQRRLTLEVAGGLHRETGGLELRIADPGVLGGGAKAPGLRLRPRG